MDRRAFFKAGFNNVAKTAVQLADDHVKQSAVHWTRPPYALDELDFLLACTRCEKCIEACPHDVIFKLPVRLGAQVAGTPALDLLNKACHLCDNWPCVDACEPGALQFPGIENETTQEFPLPELAFAQINPDACLPYSGPECGACAGSCPVPGALAWNGTRPYINPEKCTGCSLCREACIVEPKAVKITSRLQQVETD